MNYHYLISQNYIWVVSYSQEHCQKEIFTEANYGQIMGKLLVTMNYVDFDSQPSTTESIVNINIPVSKVWA